MTEPSPWEASTPEPAVERLLRPEPVEARVERPRRLDPARVLVVAAALVAIVASPLPWIERIGSGPADTWTGWRGVADGFLIAVVSAVLIGLAVSRAAAESRALVVRALPVVLAVTAVALAIGAIRTAENVIAIWEREGAAGVYQPPFFACLVAAVAMAVGAAWFGVTRLRERTGPGEPGDRIRLSRGGVAVTAVGAGGALVGAVGTGFAIGSSGLDPVALSLPLMLGVPGGALVGAWAGARLGRLLVGDGRAGPPNGGTGGDIPLERVRADRGRRNAG